MARIFIVQPSDYYPSDKVHHVCQTKQHGNLDEIYGADLYQILGSRQSLAAAKRLAERHGAKRPKVI